MALSGLWRSSLIPPSIPIVSLPPKTKETFGDLQHIW